MPAYTRDLTVASRCAAMFRQERLADTGLTGWQYSFITHLHRQPGLTQEQLADTLHLNKSSVTRNLVSLEEAGFVRRVPSLTDKRTVQVYLTPAGEGLVPVIQRVLKEWSSLVTEGFSPEELTQLSVLLERLRRNAENYLEAQKKK